MISMIIAMIIVFSIFGLMLDLGGAFIGALFELAIPAAVIYMIFKHLIPSLRGERRDRFRNASYSENSYLTENQQIRINRALRNYFQTHDRLVITGNVNLRPEGGQYNTLKDLEVYQGENQVAKLSEFKVNYPKFYQSTLDLLNMFAGQAVPQGQVSASGKAKSKREQVREEVAAQKAEETRKQTFVKKSEYDNAEDYITRINLLNDEIPSEEISNGLYQVTSYLTQIQLIEKRFPDKHAKLKKVYHYYLPILIKILEQYQKFQDSSRNSDEFKATEDQLIKTITLINGALKTVTDSLLEQDYTDISANMTTLEMLLKNDGLVEDEALKLGKKG